MIQASPINKIKLHLLDYILLLSSLIIIWGAIVYYGYALNTLGLILTGVLSILSFWFTKGFFIEKKEADQETKEGYVQPKNLINYLILNKINLILIIAFLALAISAFYRLYTAMSARALISPWQVVSYDFFWLYALSAAILVFILARAKIKSGFKLALISSFYFLSFSAAAIIYKIGYGFDPFIHQATMELITAQGSVLPKTPYYLGEYSLVIVLSKISGLTISVINKFLVPALAAIFLPPALFNTLKRSLPSQAATFLTILFLLIIGFSPFIATTPQNLSYLFLILAVLAASAGNFTRTLILSLAAAAIHPLAGLPALALSGLVGLENKGDKIKQGLKRILRLIIWLFAAFSIPIALFFSAGATAKNLLGLKQLPKSIMNLLGAPNSAGREDLISNFVYLLAHNYCLIIIAVIIYAIFLINRSQTISGQAKTSSRNFIYLASALLFAYLLSGQIRFDDIINYEQAGYANRIPVAILIFLLPLIALAIADIISRILKQNLVIRLIWLFGGICLITASLYISYPRFDKYHNSRGYSTSASDIAAVKSIDSEARGPYAVLANQQVSAAALQVFGFSHYYKTTEGDLYFYPIPTGSPLYQYYLDMVYKSPAPERMSEALSIVGVNQGYLVINKYWYQSGRMINEAKLAADKWWTINNEVFIFKYSR